jgi:hypothetical protein
LPQRGGEVGHLDEAEMRGDLPKVLGKGPQAQTTLVHVMTLSHGRMQPRRTTRTADGSASPCASSELVLDVTLKLREQAF